MNLFEIIRSHRNRNISLLTPVAAAMRGQAYQESATAGTAELADGTKPLTGFVTRDVVVGGPTLGDAIYPGRLELPFKAGDEASFEKGEAVEAEGGDFIILAPASNGLDASTALETDLSFSAGKFIVAAGAAKKFYRLKEIKTPEVEGNLRIRVEAINFI